MKYLWLIAALTWISCGGDFADKALTEAQVPGRVDQPAESDPAASTWRIKVVNDNNDPTLPDTWRAWWTARLDPVDTEHNSTIEVSDIVWVHPYIPVYSYDQETWQHFPEAAVTRPSADRMQVSFRFTSPTVYLAQHHPYGLRDHARLLQESAAHPDVQVERLGLSPGGNAIDALRISSRSTDTSKERVWVHARTHPGEVGSSHVVEGLVRFLISDAPDAQAARERFIWHVVPMVNPDGVAADNYRTTPQGQNLEVMWHGSSSAAAEVALLQAKILSLLPEAEPFVLALNLHATHSPADATPYLVTHFGPQEALYSDTESLLWRGQVRFGAQLVQAAQPLEISSPVVDGGRGFVGRPFPESWWWNLAGPSVVAATFETVHGKVGAGGRWMTPEDHRHLGRALVLAAMGEP